MRIAIVTPARPGARIGNRVTAERWGGFLTDLGHQVSIIQQWPPDDQDEAGTGSESKPPPDVLIALHARRSHQSLMRFREQHPQAAAVLALTGTDIYRDYPGNPDAVESVAVADRLIVLQPSALDELPDARRSVAHVIYQSLQAPSNGHVTPRDDRFDVIVIGHLRDVKDPFRTAEAVRDLPAASRIHVTQVGGELESGMVDRAREEMARNPRYEWIGEHPRDEVMKRLTASRLLSLTSLMEGGANAVSEAIVCGVPVVSSRISGSLGLLGDDYPGYFEVGDTAGLRALLLRSESDDAWRADLRARCIARQPLFDPAAERNALRDLLASL